MDDDFAEHGSIRQGCWREILKPLRLDLPLGLDRRFLDWTFIFIELAEGSPTITGAVESGIALTTAETIAAVTAATGVTEVTAVTATVTTTAVEATATLGVEIAPDTQY